MRSDRLRPGTAVLAILLAILLAAPPRAARAAGAPAPTRADVEARLQKGSRGPGTTEQAEIARDAPRVLVQIAGDRTATPTLRGRAMNALAYARTPEAHDFLENFIIRNLPSTEREDRQLLRKAAVSLGWQAGGRAVEVLALLLDHADAEVRSDAALALGLTRTRDAERPLRSRLERESDATVRAQIESQLRTLAPSSPGAGKP
jgi:HEAT repeat protein